ncbi:EpsG family protein [Rhodanobacter sp. 115]|uniref:EpsG family protein n=1 Tax=Rhodanobacter sp. FW021-MT20 TaxID=1162282 RepID=UPI0034E55D9E
MAYVAFIFCAFFLTAWSWLCPKYAKYLGMILFAYAVLFAGISSSSKDYSNYINMFQEIGASALAYPEKVFLGKDPLFGVLITWIQAVGLGSQWMFLVAVGFGLSLKARAFQRIFGAYITPFFVMVCLSYFSHEFAQIRLAIALGFSFLALLEICNGKKVRWLIYSMLAVGFHASAILVVIFELPMLFGLQRYQWIISVFMLLVIAGVGNILSQMGKFDGRVLEYVGEHFDMTVSMVLVALFKSGVLSYMAAILVKGQVDIPQRRLLIQCCIFSWVGLAFLLMFMHSATWLAFRVYALFDAFSVFIVAAALLKKTTSTWLVGAAYCILLLIILSRSDLLPAYKLASSYNYSH